MNPIRRILQPAVAIPLAALAGLLSFAPGASALLYDLDFGTPPHTVGQTPTVGAGPAVRETVSAILSGNPLVVASHGPLTDQPCRFLTLGAVGDQIQLNLDDLPASDTYYLAVDVAITAMDPEASLTILFDTPDVRNIYFDGDRIVRAFVPGSGSVDIGTFALDSIVRLEVAIDLAADSWSIYLDGDFAFESDFGGATMLEGIRFSTGVAPPVQPIICAIDNVTIDENPIANGSGACDRLTFGDLVLNTVYGQGAVFTSEGVAITVGPHAWNVGPCGAPYGTGTITVVSDHGACGLGKELLFNNASAAFDFGGPAREIVIPYGEYGGTVSLSVNGDCQVAENFAGLDGATLGGVAVTVFDFGQPGQSCGVIRLGGVVNTLSIGGQELYVDGVSYCPDCDTLRRSAFDDQTQNAIYTVGDSFVSGAATHTFINFFLPGASCTNPTSNGLARIDNQQLACGGGLDLWLNNINDIIDFGTEVEWLVLNYADYGGNVNVGVNGDCRNVDNLSDVNGSTIGGATVWAVDYGVPGGSCGSFYVVGKINSFGIGGQEFYIDNIRTCPVVPLGAGDPVAALPAEGILLDPARPNPAHGSTVLGFTLAQPGAVRLAIYDVSGRVVRTLVDGSRLAGAHQIAWDGRDEQGRRLPSGIYSYRAETGAMAQSRKLILLD